MRYRLPVVASRSLWLGLWLGLAVNLSARVYEIRPSTAEEDEEFERIANALQPGDELVLRGGTYSQTGRRSVTAEGTAERPITIRAAAGEKPLLTRPETGDFDHCHRTLRSCDESRFRLQALPR